MKKRELIAFQKHVKLNKEPKKPSLSKQVKQFCLITDLHGYKFIVLPKRYLLERCFWIAICSIAIMSSIGLITTILYNDEQNPLILVTETTQSPIWNYDFPAITICENNKISKKKAKDFARHLAKHNKSLNAETLRKQLRYLYYFIDTLHVTDEIAEELFKLQQIFDSNNHTAHAVLRRLGNPCDDITIKCIWKGLSRKCSNVIKQVRTTQGYCCSFNNFVFANADPSTGIVSDENPSLPYRTSSCGYHSGLILLIQNDVDDYYASSVPALGHRILIHDPYSFPDRNSRNSFSPAGVLNVLSIFAQGTHSSKEVRRIPVNIRQCLFHDEMKLHYFTRYTFANCLVEARMNLTRRICKCTPFFYFRQTESPDHKVCNLMDVPCLSKIEMRLRSAFLQTNLTLEDNGFSYSRGRLACLRDCESTFYSHRTSTTLLNNTYATYVPYLFGGVKIKDHSVMRISFNGLNAVKNRRHIIYTSDALLAFLGSILGYLTGFSFVSGVDMVYFFIKKAILRTDRRKSRAIRPKIEKSDYLKHVPILPFVN